MRTILLFSGLACALLLTGCASQKFERGPSMDHVYDNLNYQGERDAVRSLRQGMTMRSNGGTYDPAYPMVSMPVIIPVWRPAHTNPKNGRREGGQWQHIMDKESDWIE